MHTDNTPQFNEQLQNTQSEEVVLPPSYLKRKVIVKVYFLGFMSATLVGILLFFANMVFGGNLTYMNKSILDQFDEGLLLVRNIGYTFDTIKSNFDGSYDDYSAKSIAVYELESNKILFSKGLNRQTPIASLTKMASSLALINNIDLQEEVTVTKESESYEGSVLELKENQRITKKDLLKSGIIASSNQAMFLINDPEDTVLKMNKLALALGLKSTKFANPAGYDDENNYSSAEDLIAISKLFFSQATLKELSGIKEDRITDLSTGKKLEISNTNDLLRLGTQGVVGGKTGTTPTASQNLVLLYQKNNKNYIIIILNSIERYNDAYKLIARIK